LRRGSRMNRLGRYLLAVIATMAGRVPAGRGVTVRPEDVFLVSYRRSGSTWLRFLVGNLTQHEPVTFTNVGQIVPSIFEHSDRVLRRGRRVLKSHETFDPRYPRVVYLVRDPRDVALSFYFYQLKVRRICDGYPLDEFIDRFMIPKIADFIDRSGNWEEHVLSWLRLRQGRSTFRLLRYEDLLTDPGSELMKLASFLGIASDPEWIDRAVQLSSAQQMRGLEQQQWKLWLPTKRTRADIPFVRGATSGRWRNELSDRSVKKIEAAWGRTMQELGYEVSSVVPTISLGNSNIRRSQILPELNP
jgi:Sulfotransferase domain